MNALVVGAGSGIGAALVDQLARAPGYSKVFAVGRRPVSSIDHRVHWCRFDPLTDPAEVLTEQVGGNERIHTAFICIGHLHGPSTLPEKALKQLSPDNAHQAFACNATAPLLAVQACLPLLIHDEPSNVYVLSAKLGSISDNHLGGWYAYRMSKAALNMGIKTLSIELARRKHSPALTAVHPGTTRSPLSNRFVASNRCVTVAETAARLTALAAPCDASHHGQFLHWDGTPIPW